MIESHDPFDPIHEVEALIRDAGNYVQPSEDLRPRVMEAVRSQRVERIAQRRIFHAAVLFSALTFLAMSTLEHLKVPDVQQPPLVRPASDAAESDRDAATWDTVDAFREIRRRHAELLRLHL